MFKDGHHRSLQPVRSLWISPDHCTAEARWLAGWEGPCRTHLATRRPEGSVEAETTRAAVVKRRIVRQASPEHTNHVWSYDFVSAKTYDDRTARMLNLIDEHSQECLMIRSERKWSSVRVIEALADVRVINGVPQHLRSDNGPEFVAEGEASDPAEICTGCPAVISW